MLHHLFFRVRHDAVLHPNTTIPFRPNASVRRSVERQLTASHNFAIIRRCVKNQYKSQTLDVKSRLDDVDSTTIDMKNTVSEVKGRLDDVNSSTIGVKNSTIGMKSSVEVVKSVAFIAAIR